MKKGQIIEGMVERVEFPNKGIVRTEDGGRVIVKNAVPGQKVSASINKVRKGKCEGRLLEVLEHSPKEQPEAACIHAGECGGCTYQTLPYEEQLAMKNEQVKKMMDEAVDGEYIWEGIKPSPVRTEYRNKMEFSFGDEYKDGPLALGMHKRGSFHDIVTVDGCRIVDEDYSKILRGVLDFFTEHQVPFYHKMSHVGYLRHLLVRRAESTGELLAALVTSSQYDDAAMEKHLQNLSDMLLKLPLEGAIAGFLHIVNDSLGDVVKSDETHIVYGKDWFMENVLGLQFRITPFSFFQTNTKGAEVLYQRARDYVLSGAAGESSGDVAQSIETGELADNSGQSGETGESSEDSVLKSGLSGKTVFDLYSGTGTIAQILAPVAGHVIGVEIVEEAVEAAKENAALNGLTNCDFIAGDVLKVIDEIEEKPDYIVLDPPRDGIHPKALQKIIDYGVPEIVYISCKPTSLARDLVALQESGYRVKRVSCVDMFCSTVHVETVVGLQRKSM